MDISDARRILNLLDWVEQDNLNHPDPDGTVIVTFRKNPRDTVACITLRVVGDSYQVSGCAAPTTDTFEEVADAYRRAMDFIRRAKLRPQPVEIRAHEDT